MNSACSEGQKCESGLVWEGRGRPPLSRLATLTLTHLATTSLAPPPHSLNSCVCYSCRLRTLRKYDQLQAETAGSLRYQHVYLVHQGYKALQEAAEMQVSEGVAGGHSQLHALLARLFTSLLLPSSLHHSLCCFLQEWLCPHERAYQPMDDPSRPELKGLCKAYEDEIKKKSLTFGSGRKHAFICHSVIRPSQLSKQQKDEAEDTYWDSQSDLPVSQRLQFPATEAENRHYFAMAGQGRKRAATSNSLIPAIEEEFSGYESVSD